MYPRLGPIPTYSVFYTMGIIAHFVICYLTAKKWKLRHRVWITVSLLYMVSMILLAKVLYDVHQGQFSLQQLLSIEHYLTGGLWGGLLAYFGLAVPLVWLLSKPRLAGLDLVAWSIPIPWILVKMACFFNGCCYGRECSWPWAITFSEGGMAPGGVRLHPSQIYELLLMVSIWVFFKRLKIERWRGTILLWFLCLYGFGRMGLDFLRGDTERYIYLGFITTTQLLCFTAGLFASLILLSRTILYRKHT